MNVRQLDLNLLVVLDAIYTEGGITAAARRLHVTQPAVTHALNRLRDHFSDPLFVREGRTMVPTPMARNLIRPLKRSLRSIEIMLHEVDQFDPATFSSGCAGRAGIGVAATVDARYLRVGAPGRSGRRPDQPAITGG